MNPALLKVQIGPVQDFIAQARSTRDLWSGSFLISWMMGQLVLRLKGPAGVELIFPDLTTLSTSKPDSDRLTEFRGSGVATIRLKTQPVFQFGGDAATGLGSAPWP